MKAFRLDFHCYVIAADGPAAAAAGDTLRKASAQRGMEPGPASVREVSPEEIARTPGLERLIDRATKPRFGPPASDVERQAALRAIARTANGDMASARASLGAVEAAHGYLPRDVALSMSRLPAPSVRRSA